MIYPMAALKTIPTAKKAAPAKKFADMSPAEKVKAMSKRVDYLNQIACMTRDAADFDAYEAALAKWEALRKAAGL